MEPHQERVVAEKQALDEKITKLVEYLGTFKGDVLLPEKVLTTNGLLLRQLGVMTEYREILVDRIAMFGDSDGN